SSTSICLSSARMNGASRNTNAKCARSTPPSPAGCSGASGARSCNRSSNAIPSTAHRTSSKRSRRVHARTCGERLANRHDARSPAFHPGVAMKRSEPEIPMRILPAAVFILATTGAAAREPIVGLPCEGCEAVFEGLPAVLSPRARIAPPGEPGEPLSLAGRVLAADGSPRAGIVVYAYHTDAQGIYPPLADAPGRAAERHGRLRGWVASDAEGRYTFDTIRPASYPTRDVPAHIHLHVLEPGCGTYYIDDAMFTDDPLLTPPHPRAHAAGRGGSGLATPTHANGSWQVTRDIRLGAGIPGYRTCAGPAAAGGAAASAAACAWDASFVSVATTPLPAERFRGIDKTMAIRAIVERLGPV